MNFIGFSQIKYSNDFLQIGAGARSLSLSKSVVANSINSSAIQIKENCKTVNFFP